MWTTFFDNNFYETKKPDAKKKCTAKKKKTANKCNAKTSRQIDAVVKASCPETKLEIGVVGKRGWVEELISYSSWFIGCDSSDKNQRTSALNHLYKQSTYTNMQTQITISISFLVSLSLRICFCLCLFCSIFYPSFLCLSYPIATTKTEKTPTIQSLCI